MFIYGMSFLEASDDLTTSSDESFESMDFTQNSLNRVTEPWVTSEFDDLEFTLKWNGVDYDLSDDLKLDLTDLKPSTSPFVEFYFSRSVVQPLRFLANVYGIEVSESVY